MAVLSSVLLGLTGTALAHDVPNDVRLVAYLEASGQRLVLLVLVPMAALREVDVPLRAGGYIDLARAEPALREAVSAWLLDAFELYEDGVRLPRPALQGLRISLASDRSFASLAQARAHLAAPPIAESEQLYWSQQLLDVRLQTPIGSEHGRIALRARVDRLGQRVSVALHFRGRSADDGGVVERIYELRGSDHALVQLDPRWHQAAWRFVQSGAWHILEGGDHLLFLACLVIPLRRLRPLVLMATAFTVAHSLTLVATALGLGPQGLWFPPFVETLIAASIVGMALANVLGRATHARWYAAFIFGLVHGFGFAFALRESLQFAGAHVLAALVAFNAGVELGQLAALALMVPLAYGLLRVVPERAGVVVLSALAAHQAWHWMLERAASWWQHPWPRVEAADLPPLLAWATAALLCGATLWAVRGAMARWMGPAGSRR